MIAPWAPQARHGAWDAWLAILLPASGPVRWCKSHVFAGSWDGGRTPVSAVEGLTEPGEVLSLLGTSDTVTVARDRLPGTPVPAPLGLATETSGGGRWYAGDGRGFVRVDRPELTLKLDGASSSRFVWLRAPGLLTYFSEAATWTGTARTGELDGAELSGSGLLEHAWGTSLRIDARRLVRWPWQWDLLSADGGSDPQLWAGLHFHIGRRGWRCARGAARWGTSRPLVVRSGGISSRDGDEAALNTWRGQLRWDGATLDYSARVSTPAHEAAPGVWFVGFDWEGELDARGHRTVVSGRGLTEHGQPAYRR